MKMLLFTLAFGLGYFVTLCQRNQQSNKDFQLIYDTGLLKKVTPKIDLLNVEFKRGANRGKHYSLKQAHGIYLHLEQKNCLDAVKDLNDNIPIDEFVCKYPNTEIKRDVLITQEIQRNYLGKPEIQFAYINPIGDYHIDFSIENIDDLPKNYKNRTIFKYYDSEYSDSESIEAFYLMEDFNSVEIPNKYSEMINYVNFIFDTSCTVYFEDKQTHSYNFTPNAIDSFLLFINKKFNLEHKNYDYLFEEEIGQKYISDSNLNSIKSLIDSSNSINALFQRASNLALNGTYSNSAFEYIIGKLISENIELEVKRNREPRRSCGNDNAPKIQDYKIATLALRNDSLLLFLRAHQYVMRDKIGDGICNRKFCFDRLSYLSELDFIHVNIAAYFFATYLSTLQENNSYLNEYSKFYELYDFKNRNEIENALLEAISDPQLDLFNRLYVAKLFAKYCQNEKVFTIKETNIGKLNEAVLNFPNPIRFSYQNYIHGLEEENVF